MYKIFKGNSTVQIRIIIIKEKGQNRLLDYLIID